MIVFKERLREARLSAGFTQERLAERIGVAKSTLTGYEKGNSEPDMSKIEKIMAVLKVDANFLFQDEMRRGNCHTQPLSRDEYKHILTYRALDDHGKDLVDTVLEKEHTRCTHPTPSAPDVASGAVGSHGPKTTRMRIYDSPAAAGAPLWAESDYETRTYAADDVPEGAAYGVRIAGQSMEPDIPDGCIVWVERTEAIKDGDIVIAWVDGEGTVCKRAVCSASGRIIRLESINPAYAGINGRDLVGLRIYGKVVGCAAE